MTAAGVKDMALSGSSMKTLKFDSREQLFAALAEESVADLRDALSARGRASLIVSGGSSPMPLYRQMAAMPLAWENVLVALADERWVPSDSSDSNQLKIEQSLLQDQAASAQFVPMKTADRYAVDAQAHCEAQYAALPGPFDVTILGLGNDGHTASLFPQAAGLEAAMDPQGDALCSAILAQESPVTGPLTERMSLTLAGLLNSREIKLLIMGADKWHTLQQALAGEDSLATPIRALLQQQQVPVAVYWAP